MIREIESALDSLLEEASCSPLFTIEKNELNKPLGHLITDAAIEGKSEKEVGSG